MKPYFILFVGAFVGSIILVNLFGFEPVQVLVSMVLGYIIGRLVSS